MCVRMLLNFGHCYPPGYPTSGPPHHTRSECCEEYLEIMGLYYMSNTALAKGGSFKRSVKTQNCTLLVRSVLFSRHELRSVHIAQGRG